MKDFAPATSLHAPKVAAKIVWPTIFISLLCWASFFTAIYTYHLGLMSLWMAMTINTVAGYLIFTPVHEAAHGNISSNISGLRWLDDCIGYTGGFMLFGPFSIFKVLHLQHHSFTNHPEKDPDFWVKTQNPVILLIKMLSIMPNYYRHAFFRPSKTMKKALPLSLFIFVIQAAVWYAWAQVDGWQIPLLLWFTPAILSLAILALVLDWIPHTPHHEQDRLQNTRICDYPFLNTLTMGHSYHLMHHLYPQVPWYHYRKTYIQYSKILKEKGCPIQGNYSIS